MKRIVALVVIALLAVVFAGCGGGGGGSTSGLNGDPGGPGNGTVNFQAGYSGINGDVGWFLLTLIQPQTGKTITRDVPKVANQDRAIDRFSLPSGNWKMTISVIKMGTIDQALAVQEIGFNISPGQVTDVTATL